MSKLNLRLKHLSQEHMAAMRLAVAMRESMPEDESNLPDVARKITNIFASEFEPHFASEEMHLVPQLRAIGRDDLADRTINEHTRLRALVAALGAVTPALLVELSVALQAHVNFEENVVWEVLEAATQGDTAHS